MKLIMAVLLLAGSLSIHARELKLLTWNTFMIPKPFKNSRQSERRQAIARELQKTDYDVIVLQEAFMDSFKTTVKSALKTTHPYVYWPKKVRGIFKIFDSGVMVLSKTPLHQVDKTYYTSCTTFDCYASKGAIMLETNLAGQEIQLVVTHMQSGQNPTATRVRSKQLQQIKKMMQRNQRPGVPQLLAGDLNINAYGEGEYEYALDNLNMVAPQIAGKLWSTKAPQTGCFKKPSTEIKRVDHVWYRDHDKVFQHTRQQVTPIRGKINGQLCDLSDHLPVSMDVQLAD